ncbi:MAG: IS256 family transposase, partial [Phycisphaerae bacterium]|nr:IS256 family transposase [Phycisphaerae bacterium]
MGQCTTTDKPMQLEVSDVLNEILRDGARRMLATAIDNEVGEYIAAHCDQRDEKGRRLVVRNGHLPQRRLQTGLGSIEVRQS